VCAIEASTPLYKNLILFDRDCWFPVFVISQLLNNPASVSSILKHIFVYLLSNTFIIDISVPEVSKDLSPLREKCFLHCFEDKVSVLSVVKTDSD
jgi:hypothetical protein